MNYKITGVSTTQLTVEYDDGSWAEIPVHQNSTKADYLEQIYNFSSDARTIVSVADNPIKIGDEGVVGEGIDTTPIEEPKFSWKDVRRDAYPDLENQLEAWSDHYAGDSTKLDLVKSHVAMVKELIPKEENQDKTWTFDQREAKIAEIEADSRSFNNGSHA